MNEKAFVGFRTHGVMITRTPTLIHCFKTATIGEEEICSYEIFDIKDESDAVDFIITPMMSSPPNHDVITAKS